MQGPASKKHKLTIKTTTKKRTLGSSLSAALGIPSSAEIAQTSAPAPDIQTLTVQRIEDQALPITSSAGGLFAPDVPPSANETIPQMPISGSSAIMPSAQQENQLKQAQDSPPDSLFSFDIEDFLAEDEASSSSTSAQQTMETSLADEVKNTLQEMLVFLNKNIVELVQDAGPIRNILQSIRRQLTPELKSAIIPAAFIECH
ncbi:uncharacterized protein [Miscanthus floridulus]|uniref:uncharacterized protein n=1 Tax=Miscanthus floridulus TaxID=154761 RepID=UPI003458850D